MKCINCNQEIPDTSTTCPFCNNPVTPTVTPVESAVTTDLPNTPDNYVLPKDQVVQTSNIPSPPSMDEEVTPSVPVRTEVPAEPNLPKPPQIEDTSIPSPNIASEPTYIDPTTLNLDNVDLNANPTAESIDLTKSGGKIASTIIHNKDEEERKLKRKRTIIIVLFVIILVGMGIGGFFYFTQFKSTDKRIDKVVDGLFSFTTSLNNSKIENGSGNYNLTYTSSMNNENLSFDISGKYGYDLPNKKIDVIANIKKYNHNGELIDEELNSELYLESKRAYVLLQNFDTKYFYTNINNTKNVLDDIESRFDKPEELIVFKLLNIIYDGGLEEFSKDYDRYIDNISQNDINYMNIINGLKKAVKEALKNAPSTQTFENNKNVIRISLNKEDKVKAIYKSILSSLKDNKNAYQEIVKLYGGNDSTFYDAMSDKIEKLNVAGINGNITIVTDPFKNNLISISLPIIRDNKVHLLTISPKGSGYKIVLKLENKEVLNVTYSKSSSKESQTTTKKYNLKGIAYKNDIANNFELNLEMIQDITPQKIDVITRNSIDYQYLTADDFNTIAGKIKEFGNLGVVFSSHYKGVQPQDGETQDAGI